MRGQRVEWVDVAKAFAIILVVLFHAPLAAYGDQGVWEPVNAVFATFRMPLFFTVSGLFAASTLAKPWPWVLRNRVGLYLYLYVLWWLLREAGFTLIARLDGTERDGSNPLLMFIHPQSAMWFLYALALFFLVARALRPVPVAVQLTAAGVLSAIAGTTLTFGDDAWKNMAMYLVFFLLGAHLSASIRRNAERATPPISGALVAAFLLATVVVTVADVRYVPPFRLLLGLIAVAAGLALAVVIDKTFLRRSLAYLGRNTLPVYVMHSLALAALAAVLPTDFLASPASPPILTALAISVALLANLALRNVPGLFTLPRRRTKVPAPI